MGVHGLLPQLKSVLDQVHISKYSGKRAGIDGCSWLYKGAYSCAADLVLGRDTDAYLNYALQHIKLLRTHHVTPVFVFDGAPLPAKERVHETRHKNREIWRDKAIDLVERGEGESREAFAAFNRAVYVSNDMIRKLVAVLKRMEIEFYVAPYEADAQLAFLSRTKFVDVVVSEDSDLIPYGCKTILFKLSPEGWGSELKRRSLGANEELSFAGWNEEMFIELCVLSGCDYCASVPGVGVMSAYKLVNSHRTPCEVIDALKSTKGDAVPNDYLDHFLSAILTFRHHLVFDPRDLKLKMLNPLTLSNEILPLVDKQLLFLGNIEMGDDVVASIARAEIHPSTHESYVWKEAGAALLSERHQEMLRQQQKQQEEHQALAKAVSIRSQSSSEASIVAGSKVDLRHRKRSSKGEVSVSEDGSENSEPQHPRTSTMSTNPGDGLPMRFERPRPSSSSSWAHLDSLLGSSAHILNFRSPKVSDNFKPLSSHKPSSSQARLETSADLAHTIKAFEDQPVRAPNKRIRNPINRRRDDKGSGFEGEVLCRVEASRDDSDHATLRRVSVDGADPDDIPGASRSRDPSPTAPKKQRLINREVLASAVNSGDGDHRSAVRLTRPTPFGCLSRQISMGDVEREGQSEATMASRSSPTSPSTGSSSYARATSAEAKWDRILQQEEDEEIGGRHDRGGYGLGRPRDFDIMPGADVSSTVGLRSTASSSSPISSTSS